MIPFSCAFLGIEFRSYERCVIMDSDAALLAAAEDKARQAAAKNTVAFTAFLDARQRTLLRNAMKNRAGVSLSFYGGFPDAERTVAVFLPGSEEPEEYFRQHPEENPLALLKIHKDGFSALGHRDYLGAVIALGVKREAVGDILSSKDGCEMFVLKTVGRFLEENLRQAGRGTLAARAADVSEFIGGSQKPPVEKRETVASPRLDGIVGAAFNISRNVAAQAVNTGRVFVNGVQVLKPDAKTAAGDKIVLRGKGKAVIMEFAGETKKGRTVVFFQLFI